MRFPFSSAVPAMLAVVLAFCGAGASRADEALRKIQQSLRDQGFYYGAIDGSPGDETTQAIRRYQIRNGLGVSGQLNDETRASIARTGAGSASTAPKSSGGSSSSRPGAANSTPPPLTRDRSTGNNEPDYRLAPREAAQPPATARRSPDAAERGDDEESAATAQAPSYGGPRGRPDLRADPASPGRGYGPPSAGGGYGPSAGGGGYAPSANDRNPPPARYGSAPSPGLIALFEQSPYEFAPPVVQSDVVRRAQTQLLRSGFYDGQTDGVPGPQTSEAIANFQEVNRLRRTARLDVNTLALLRLLPARRPGPPPGYYAPRPGGIYEGRIVP